MFLERFTISRSITLRQKVNVPCVSLFSLSFPFSSLFVTDAIRIIELDIATELWNLLIPLDPESGFPEEHLEWWLEFLVSKGSKSVSKDTWNLVSFRLPLVLLERDCTDSLFVNSQFLEFTRGVDPTFSKHDEEGTYLISTSTILSLTYFRLPFCSLAAWPSLIDDFVEHAREKISSSNKIV